MTDSVSDCPFRKTCARLGGICQCAEERQGGISDENSQLPHGNIR